MDCDFTISDKFLLRASGGLCPWTLGKISANLKWIYTPKAIEIPESKTSLLARKLFRRNVEKVTHMNFRVLDLARTAVSKIPPGTLMCEIENLSAVLNLYRAGER